MKEESNVINEEIGKNRKPTELSDEQLKQVSGGNTQKIKEEIDTDSSTK